MKLKKLALTICICLSSVVTSAAIASDIQIPVRPVNNERIPVQGTPVQQQNSYAGANELRRKVNETGIPVDDYGRAQHGQGHQAVSADSGRSGFLARIEESFSPEQKFDLKPGRNIIVPVGQGFNNALRTNFKSLSVKTSADSQAAVLQVEGGNLYVTLRNMQPISLLLSEDGVLESEVSVVLVPISAPPAMVDINIEMTPSMIAKAVEHQEALERERQLEEALNNQHMQRDQRISTHANNLIALLKPIAKGNTPNGFSITNDIPSHMTKPCQISVFHQAGQRLTGARELIDVVLVHNDSDRVYHVREEMCLSDGALSVAIFPRAYLQPGEETEIFIIRDKYFQPVEQRVTRPRLTRGAE